MGINEPDAYKSTLIPINTQSEVFINKMMVLCKMILMGTLQKLVAEGKEGVELSYRSFLIASL